MVLSYGNRLHFEEGHTSFSAYRFVAAKIGFTPFLLRRYTFDLLTNCFVKRGEWNHSPTVLWQGMGTDSQHSLEWSTVLGELL